MQEIKNRSAAAAEFLKRTLADPVLWYTVLMMTTLMYHFYKKGYIIFTLASIVVTYVLFRLFDYMQKHHFIGGVFYIGAWYIAFQVFSVLTQNGYQYYEDVLLTKPIYYALWFFTPQLALDYNIWYSWATFILFQFFMASVLYYFARVRYRVLMNFLIMMIPFLIYGKEYENMPIIFIILIVMSYLALMVYCRQLYEDKKTVVVGRKGILTSAGAFTLSFMVIASLFPKPQIKANREAVENLIAAERFTDRLVASLSGFRGSSSGQQFRGNNSTIPLFYVKAEEPLHFKTSTYTSYNFGNDSWKGKEYDSDKEKNVSSYPCEIDKPGELPERLLQAASMDSSFAQKYGLTEFVGKNIEQPDTKSVDVYTQYRSGGSVPVPENVSEITDTTFEGRLKLSVSGVLNQSEYEYDRDERFSFSYSQASFMDNEFNRKFINKISSADYKSLLADAREIFRDAYRTAPDSEADDLERAYKVIVSEYKTYSRAMNELDYDDNVKIRELAQSVTTGLSTDYAKAQKLELYFFNNGYEYDLEYVKSQAENVENFIFQTKRGVCYEYATAMVLMTRACGIPARYCEGYYMTDYKENSDLGTNFVITPMDAHGYPEVYIKGLGWTVFEPTISSPSQSSDTKQQEAENGLAAAGFVLLGVAVVILLVYLLLPTVLHKVFIRLCRKKAPSAAAIAAMQRVCRVYRLGRTVTSAETESAVRAMSGADISQLTMLFDRAAYGGEQLTEAERGKAIEVYISAYEAYNEARRGKNKKAADI